MEVFNDLDLLCSPHIFGIYVVYKLWFCTGYNMYKIIMLLFVQGKNTSYNMYKSTSYML